MSLFKSSLLVVAVSLLSLGKSNSGHAVEAIKDPTFTFGVVPQQAASKVTRLWAPILESVSKECACILELKTSKDIPSFENQLSKSTYDFAYMNPYHFVVFNETSGYQAIAKQKDKLIYGIIVTRKDSNAKTLKDLEGTSLAFPSPAAFAASIITRANLHESKVKFDPVYVSSHDSVYLSVSKGFFSAGGGIIRTLNNTPPKLRDQLKILWKSKGYTPHAFAAHERIPPQIVQSVKNALVKMGDTPEGKSLLNALNFKSMLISAKNNDWDDIRQLNLDEIKESH